jgi:hypothetical protein
MLAAIALVTGMLAPRVTLPRTRASLSMSELPPEDAGPTGTTPLVEDATEPAGENPLASATTYAGLAANPLVVASLYSLQTTGCGLPRGPFGVVGALETVAYLVVAGIVFSWTPSEGGFGSAGLDLASDDGDTDVKGARVGLSGVVELVSFVTFAVGFVLLVQSIVAPVAVAPGACGDAAASGGLSFGYDADDFSL